MSIVELDDIKGKKVLVFGLGLSGGGVGAVRFLARHGAEVTVADEKRKKDLASSLEQLKKFKKLKFSFGKAKVSLLKDVDMMVVNPAVPLDHPLVRAAKKKGIRLESELGLFIRLCKAKYIAVTGSKGKSTVARLIHAILEEDGRRAYLGGNIGISLLDSLDDIGARDYVVLEVSSFQLDLFRETDTPFRPYVAVLTNVFHDHLDRYAGFAAYERSKLSLFAHQTRSEYAVVHESMKKKMKKVKAKKVYFSHILPKFIDESDVRLIGAHNRANVAAAAEVCSILNLTQKVIRSAVQKFEGLEHRLEFVRYVRGVEFYNDSFSTTPESTLRALESFPRKAVLIAGGANKDLSFTKLSREIGVYAKSVHLIGKSAREMARLMKKSGKGVKIKRHTSLEKAVHAAFSDATIGDVVLFSPANASFDMFANARERGEKFKECVNALVPSVEFEA